MMLELHKLLTPSAFGTSPKSQSAEFRGGVHTPEDKERVAREIENTDDAIDRLVYELSPTGMVFGLSPEEIAIVEGKSDP